MIIKFQTFLIRKKHFVSFIGFLLLLALSWYVWTWVIPQQPRATIIPLEDSEFVAFTFDSKKLITREPQWYMPPGAWRLWQMKRRPSCIQVWDAETGTLLRTLAGEWADTDSVIPAQDSQQLIGWTRGEREKTPDSIKTCDLLSGETIQQASLPCKYGSLVKLEYSPDGKWLGITPISGFVEHFHIWRVGSDKLVHFDNIGARITFSEDGEFLAGSDEGASEFSVEIWRLHDLSRPWRKYKWAADEGFVFPDCKTAATYHRNDFKLIETKLWDLTTGRLLATFPPLDSGSRIRFLDLPPDVKILSNYVDWTASTTIWDISGNPKLLAIIKDWKITDSADRNWMLQSEENGVDLVGPRSGKRFSLIHSSDEPTSNQGAVGQFSPDSRMVAVTGIYPRAIDNSFFRWIRNHLPVKLAGQWRRVARLWDVETGAEIGVFHGCDDIGFLLHRSSVVLFSPNSKTLATLQDDGTVRMWDVPPRTRIWQILGSAIAFWMFVTMSAHILKKMRQGKVDGERRPSKMNVSTPE
jgi:WD40 repeat protein